MKAIGSYQGKQNHYSPLLHLLKCEENVSTQPSSELTVCLFALNSLYNKLNIFKDPIPNFNLVVLQSLKVESGGSRLSDYLSIF